MHEQISSYIQVLRGMDKASGTIDSYRTGLELYSSWLHTEGIEPKDITTRDLQRYLGWLKGEKEYAPKTIRTRFVAVNQFHQDLANTSDVETNPAGDVNITDYAPKRTLKEEATKERRVWMSKEEIEKLVTSVPSPQVRNRLIVLFQYFTGLRRQEVCDVKISDLDREQRMVQVSGKYSKVHTAHWQPKLDGLLTTWLDMGHRDALPYARESEYLFVSRNAPQMGGNHLNNIVKQAAENAGIQEVLYVDAGGSKQHKITSHTLRHSFAMHWLENGGSIAGLSKNLAHASVKTTEIYGEIQDERASEEYEEFAPDIDF